MNRTVIIVIGAVLAVAVGVVVIWLLATSAQPIQQPANNTSDQNQGQEQPEVGGQDTPSDQVPLDPNAANNSGSQTASVIIENSAFTPARITVKKGTTVTWTNEDSMEHNVVSDDDAPAGGPPKTADLLSQGEVFSFKFDTVGTFPYHCTPHPFMQGTVEVVE